MSCQYIGTTNKKQCTIKASWGLPNENATYCARHAKAYNKRKDTSIKLVNICQSLKSITHGTQCSFIDSKNKQCGSYATYGLLSDKIRVVCKRHLCLSNDVHKDYVKISNLCVVIGCLNISRVRLINTITITHCKLCADLDTVNIYESNDKRKCITCNNKKHLDLLTQL